MWEKALGQMLPKDLPSQAQSLLVLVADLNQNIRTLADVLTAASADRPEPDGIVFQLPGQTSQQLKVSKILVSADTTGLWSFRVGTATLFSIYLAANMPQLLDLSGIARVTIGRGLQVQWAGPAGGLSQSVIFAVPA